MFRCIWFISIPIRWRSTLRSTNNCACRSEKNGILLQENYANTFLLHSLPFVEQEFIGWHARKSCLCIILINGVHFCELYWRELNWVVKTFYPLKFKSLITTDSNFFTKINESTLQRGDFEQWKWIWVSQTSCEISNAPLDWFREILMLCNGDGCHNGISSRVSSIKVKIDNESNLRKFTEIFHSESRMEAIKTNYITLSRFLPNQGDAETRISFRSFMFKWNVFDIACLFLLDDFPPSWASTFLSITSKVAIKFDALYIACGWLQFISCYLKFPSLSL